MKSVSLGYSPCPNDTFIFYALIHGKIDTGGLSFNEVLLDVETLNQKALHAELDLTKISYHAFGFLRDKYSLLRSGGALGRGCGPLVVAKHDYTMGDLRNKRIAIPGRLTTAYLLLQLFDPAFMRAHGNTPLHLYGRDYSAPKQLPDSAVIEMPFHKIMDAVAKEEIDAGIIIHESRFTYPSYGLKQIMDLGEWWEKDTGLPIPLGCIIAKRSLGDALKSRIDRTIRQSVEYALSKRDEPTTYIKDHSQELSDDVINKHIDLYVNNFSIDIGQEGEKAVSELISRAEAAGIIPKS
jgi:1,4-dihydroxy-6-naphthoate synthase